MPHQVKQARLRTNVVGLPLPGLPGVDRSTDKRTGGPQGREQGAAGVRVSVRDDENTLEMDSGDD